MSVAHVYSYFVATHFRIPNLQENSVKRSLLKTVDPSSFVLWSMWGTQRSSVGGELIDDQSCGMLHAVMRRSIMDGITIRTASTNKGMEGGSKKMPNCLD